MVDSQGHLLRVKVHPADVPDGEGAREVLYRLGQRWPQLQLLWADSHYGGDELAAWVWDELGVTIEVVRRPAGQKGWFLVRRRWVVERSFAHLGRSRRLSKDYEARAKYSESQVYLASIRQLVRRIAALTKAA